MSHNHIEGSSPDPRGLQVEQLPKRGCLPSILVMALQFLNVHNAEAVQDIQDIQNNSSQHLENGEG